MSKKESVNGKAKEEAEKEELDALEKDFNLPACTIIEAQTMIEYMRPLASKKPEEVFPPTALFYIRTLTGCCIKS